jgi:hypothetical protein
MGTLWPGLAESYELIRHGEVGLSSRGIRTLCRSRYSHRRPRGTEEVTRMSPTVFRDGPFRFFFFSREESRLHIHVQTADAEAKF